jgi:hypothetical protein
MTASYSDPSGHDSASDFRLMAAQIIGHICENDSLSHCALKDLKNLAIQSCQLWAWSCRILELKASSAYYLQLRSIFAGIGEHSYIQDESHEN